MERPCDYSTRPTGHRPCDLLANWRVVDIDTGDRSFVCDRHLIDAIRTCAAKGHQMLVESLDNAARV